MNYETNLRRERKKKYVPAKRELKMNFKKCSVYKLLIQLFAPLLLNKQTFQRLLGLDLYIRTCKSALLSVLQYFQVKHL